MTLAVDLMKVLTPIAILLLLSCVASVPKLDSWSRTGDANWTSIADITKSTNQSGSGFLVSTGLYADFELNVEFKPDIAVNSGVLVRCQDPQDIALSNCYEINIWDMHPNQDYRTGAIVLHSAPPYAHLDTVGHWNQYRILAKGNDISVWLNQKATAKMTNAAFSNGHIALQSAGGTIQFRNLSIKTIPQ